ncbi:unnamed protein product, partial [Rotaria magnacalcarata]
MSDPDNPCENITDEFLMILSVLLGGYSILIGVIPKVTANTLVLNNRSTVDIPNDVIYGQLQQQLKYHKFRRVQTKAGKAVFYLFFRKEAETYYALRTAASMNDISLVRYNYARYFDRFSNKDIFKSFVRRVSEQIAVQRLKIPE